MHSRRRPSRPRDPAPLAAPAPPTEPLGRAADRRPAPSAVRRAAIAYSEGSVVSSNGSCNARLSFPPDFVGFQGHFPGNPILPGVCLIEAVLGVLESAHGKPLHLRKIASAKFREPVKPDQPLVIECASSAEEHGLRVSAQVSCAGARVAELVLHVTAS